ncbi:hypothetical protein C4D60_Mb00t18990 [Musa balbisiana]|uniref:Uncharacterized protein n=1 Tax=Musa balbisiana TaxID=52838 RepID=A0A4S8I572_MUSBA|nr:hypothetical protein C4D60_Mb00t18990 [Musa balbisiana]
MQAVALAIPLRPSHTLPTTQLPFLILSPPRNQDSAPPSASRPPHYSGSIARSLHVKQFCIGSSFGGSSHLRGLIRVSSSTPIHRRRDFAPSLHSPGRTWISCRPIRGRRQNVHRQDGRPQYSGRVDAIVDQAVLSSDPTLDRDFVAHRLHQRCAPGNAFRCSQGPPGRVTMIAVMSCYQRPQNRLPTYLVPSAGETVLVQGDPKTDCRREDIESFRSLARPETGTGGRGGRRGGTDTIIRDSILFLGQPSGSADAGDYPGLRGKHVLVYQDEVTGGEESVFRQWLAQPGRRWTE